MPYWQILIFALLIPFLILIFISEVLLNVDFFFSIFRSSHDGYNYLIRIYIFLRDQHFINLLIEVSKPKRKFHFPFIPFFIVVITIDALCQCISWLFLCFITTFQGYLKDYNFISFYFAGKFPDFSLPLTLLIFENLAISSWE